MDTKIPLIGLLSNVVLAIGKVLIGIFSGSSAILADGVHSSMDVFSSGISYIGIKISKKPADKEHPYGHYKAEVITGLIITIILFLTGIWIIYDSLISFSEPKIIAINYISLGIMVFSAFLNEIMARLKIKYGKKYNSISLISDGVHSRVDVLTSIAIFAGLIVSNYFVQADSIMALLVGIYIVKESVSIGREASDLLLDKSAGEEVEEKIREIASQHDIKVSDLKTQKRGPMITANIEIELPSKLSVEEATKISNDLREDLIENIKNLQYVAIQIKSYDVSSAYFEPKNIFSKLSFGRGFGWQRRGKIRDVVKNAQGLGHGGYCICPNCGYKIKHERGVPCSSMKCPKCGVKLKRNNNY